MGVSIKQYQLRTWCFLLQSSLQVVVFGTLILLSSCDSTSKDLQSTPNEGSAPNSDLSSTAGDSSLNGGLNGRLITTFRDLPVETDLATGASRLVPLRTIQDTLAAQDQSIRSTQVYFTGNISGNGYAQSAQGCYFNTENQITDDSCIAVFNRDFERQAFFRTRNIELDVAAKLSRSGKYLAFSQHSYGFNISRLYIMDAVTGEFLDRYSVPLNTSQREIEGGASPLAWGPNDELAYTVPSDERVTVYITDPVTLDVARTINLPAAYAGEADSLALSPDGNKLLIGYRPEKNGIPLAAGSVLLLDLVSLELSVPIVDARDANTIPLNDDVNGQLLSPRWSPTGEHIMVVRKSSGIASTDGSVLPSNHKLYVVPATASRTIVAGDQPTAAIDIYMQNPSNGQLRQRFIGDLATDIPYFDWLP